MIVVAQLQAVVSLDPPQAEFGSRFSEELQLLQENQA